MVNIDNVYQKVLVIANKEQRGYITPQEFNLLANQAQLEIFEQYFYDLNNSKLRDSGRTLNDKTTDIINQKLDLFMRTDGPGVTSGWVVSNNALLLPPEVYRVKKVTLNRVTCDYMDSDNFNEVINAGYLVKPTPKSPIWTTWNNRLRVNNGGNALTNVGLHYYIVPPTPSWGYFIIGDKALYDPSNTKTTHFELHQAEEPELVYKILKLAGISMKQDDIMKSGQGLESLEKQQEKL